MKGIVGCWDSAIGNITKHVIGELIRPHDATMPIEVESPAPIFIRTCMPAHYPIKSRVPAQPRRNVSIFACVLQGLISRTVTP